MTHVLLAEDDPAIAEPLARALTREGYDVVVQGTGKGAIESASGADIVVLDLGLPDSGDPVKLVDDISSECPGMQIAIVTGGVHDPKLRELLRQRVVALLPKPVTKGQLEAILDGNPQIN